MQINRQLVLIYTVVGWTELHQICGDHRPILGFVHICFRSDMLFRFVTSGQMPNFALFDPL